MASLKCEDRHAKLHRYTISVPHCRRGGRRPQEDLGGGGGRRLGASISTTNSSLRNAPHYSCVYQEGVGVHSQAFLGKNLPHPHASTAHFAHREASTILRKASFVCFAGISPDVYSPRKRANSGAERLIPRRRLAPLRFKAASSYAHHDVKIDKAPKNRGTWPIFYNPQGPRCPIAEI